MFFRTDLSLKVDQSLQTAQFNIKRANATIDQLYTILKLDATQAADAVSPDQAAIETALTQLKDFQCPYWRSMCEALDTTKNLIQRRWWIPLKAEEAPWEDRLLVSELLNQDFDHQREELNNTIAFSKGLALDRMQVSIAEQDTVK